MDNIKIPRVSAETPGNQEVEVYLNDLVKRFKEQRKQHEAIIENSVHIIQEINEISSEICFIKTKSNSKIKDLIREFEAGPGKEKPKISSIVANGKSNIEKKLENVDKSNVADILKESLLVLRRAKDSLNKIDKFLEQIVEDSKINSKSPNSITNFRARTTPSCQARNIEVTPPPRAAFSSCFSSNSSLINFKSLEDWKTGLQVEDDVSTGFFDMGYQGDIDESGCDLHANKKMKEKSDD